MAGKINQFREATIYENNLNLGYNNLYTGYFPTKRYKNGHMFIKLDNCK